MRKILSFLMLAAALPLSAQLSFMSGAKTGSTDRDGKPTFINADAMDIDIGRNRATFMGNVVVNDPEVVLTCRKMTIFLAEDKKKDGDDKGGDDKGGDFGGRKLNRIECEDEVVITRKAELSDGEVQRATAGKAVYTYSNGSITLTDSPVLIKGTSKISGSRITLYSNSERMEIVDGIIEARDLKTEKK